MKFAKGVTIEQIENVIDWILADMKKEQLEAREAYKVDSNDIFHGYMDTMYGFVEDMIRSRLSILRDEKESDLRQRKEPVVCFPEREPGPDIPPHYDSELGVWTTRVDERRESGDIGYVCAEFSGAGLIYPFNTRRSRENGWHDHAHGFDGVLEALIEDEAPEAFSVEGFEEYYSEQELKMLRKVQEKLLAMKKVSGAGGTEP